MLRVCLVHRDLHAITRGGIATIYVELAIRLRRAGYHVILLTQESPHPLSLPGITTVTLPRTEDLDVHRHAVAEALTALHPDVVECSSWEAEALHYLRRPHESRAPVIVRGEFSAATMQAADLVTAEYELVHSADRVLAVSNFAAHDLAEAYAVPVPTVVPNGVDRAHFRPGPIHEPTSGFRITLDAEGVVASRTPLANLPGAGQPPTPWIVPDNRPHLVWVGKITPMKGWCRLEEIVASLEHRVHWTVLLGHSRAFCPVTMNGVDDVTILQDLSRADLVSFYRSADWLISTSKWEGFGLAIAEALACGTPALLPTDLKVAPELLSEASGTTYSTVDELITILQQPRRLIGYLPARLDWDYNASVTGEVYHKMTSVVEAR